MKYYLTRLNQKGAVSLISVVIFIIIIMIVIMGYLASALSQQRTATNFDLSTRAYYSAESGIQDALRALADNPSLSKNTCTPYGGAAAGKLGNTNGYDYGLEYTCQIIDPEPGEVRGITEPNQTTAMFRLNPKTNNAQKLRIKWSLTNQSNGVVYEARDRQDLPQITDWQANKFNPMLRISLINHPLSSITRNQISQRVAFLNPADTDDPITFKRNADVAESDTLTNANCTNRTNEYRCEKIITLDGYDFGADAVYLRIGSVYAATDFQVELLDSNNNPIDLTQTQVAVDVTGRAKDVYRRVRQAFPLSGGYFEDHDIDAAVVSAEGICKLFSITEKPEDFNAKCNPLTD